MLAATSYGALYLCASTFSSVIQAGDLASPLLLLLGGVVVGGIIAAARTRNTGRASK